MISTLRLQLVVALLISVLNTAAAQDTTGPVIQAEEPSSASSAVTTSTEVFPIGLGTKAPDAVVYDADGNRVRLSDIYSSAPTLLVFYRGGWCPYCSTHLGKLSAAEDRITELGYQIYAISPDSPEHLKEFTADTGLNYQLLSDSSADAIRAFGLAFRLDDQTFERYRNFQTPIDLESRAGGQTHHLLPIPAAYLIGKDGLVQFEYHHADYKERIDVEELLEAATMERNQ